MKSKSSSGFTLIELVAVIVILGILAAIAIPRYVDMSVDAADASAKGTAGAVSAGSAVNMSQYAATIGVKGTPVTSASKCSDLSAFVNGGALPANVTFVAPTATLTCAGIGTSDGTSCKLAHSSGTASGFAVTAVCTGT